MKLPLVIFYLALLYTPSVIISICYSIKFSEMFCYFSDSSLHNPCVFYIHKLGTYNLPDRRHCKLCECVLSILLSPWVVDAVPSPLHRQGNWDTEQLERQHSGRSLGESSSRLCRGPHLALRLQRTRCSRALQHVEPRLPRVSSFLLCLLFPLAQRFTCTGCSPTSCLSWFFL